jgi:hypothetical protein
MLPAFRGVSIGPNKTLETIRARQTSAGQSEHHRGGSFFWTPNPEDLTQAGPSPARPGLGPRRLKAKATQRRPCAQVQMSAPTAAMSRYKAERLGERSRSRRGSRGEAGCHDREKKGGGDDILHRGSPGVGPAQRPIQSTTRKPEPVGQVPLDSSPLIWLRRAHDVAAKKRRRNFPNGQAPASRTQCARSGPPAPARARVRTERHTCNQGPFGGVPEREARHIS